MTSSYDDKAANIEAQIAGDRLYRVLWEQRWSDEATRKAGREFTATLTEEQRQLSSLAWGFSSLLSQWVQDEATLRRWVRRVLEIDAAGGGE